MRRCLPYLLLFLSPLCQAECALSHSDNGTLSISVAGNGPCFRSQEQRAAFAQDFKTAVRTELSDSSNPQRKPVHDSHAALTGFDHLRRQSEVLNGHGPIYYGQRR
ncbi:hypothetical protein [Noviherbaspirillum pedocola]|uniref:Uncharacterized protein n=1 Tax=Noviherbaspirillum pedocola TaxID=2801341 RepID=A0A934SW96_9BURK|nr:hypothetical protein [Noviherbaspirillum pedocola]MBK4736550.1 hypothetical protein [Noviherbaspirillum pedocola]